MDKTENIMAVAKNKNRSNNGQYFIPLKNRKKKFSSVPTEQPETQEPAFFKDNIRGKCFHRILFCLALSCYYDVKQNEKSWGTPLRLVFL